jgi:hypothetical protein
MKYVLCGAVAMIVLLVCGVGWYWCDNPSGNIGWRVMEIGCAIVRPGHIVVALLSGNFHGGFGDWRDPFIKIGFSSFVWLGVIAVSNLAIRALVRSFRGTSK